MPKQINLDVKQLRSIHIFREPVSAEDGSPTVRFRLVGEYELTDDNDSVLYSRQIEIAPDGALQNKINGLYEKLLDAAQEQEGVKPKAQAQGKSIAPKGKKK